MTNLGVRALCRVWLAALVLTATPWAMAEITVGVVVSQTGAAASQGIPEKKMIELLPRTLGGEPVRYIVLDDATDPTAAVKAARKLTSEDKVDVLLAGSSTPTTLGIAEVALEARTPQISMAPMAPRAELQPWVYVVPQSADLMIDAVLEHMKAHGVKTVGHIGYSNSWGDLVKQSLVTLSPKYGIKLVNDERYARNDTSVMAQVLKTISLSPDAVMVGATGTSAVLPQLTLQDQGYKGKIYHTHGAVNEDFLRLGGKRVDGAFAPIGPVVVYKDLPVGDPVRAASLEFVKLYEKGWPSGPINAYATWAYDGYLLLDKAVAEALKVAKPGTPEFRAALRATLESKTSGMVGTNGIYDMTPADHNGLDRRARVMVEVVGGDWRLAR